MKKWNPYILAPDKKEGKGRWVLWIALLTLLSIFLLQNEYVFDFRIGFRFSTYPKDDDPAPKALHTQVIIEDPVIRHRDKLTQSLYVRSI